MKKTFCLAPMEGYTDPAFRLLCGKYGAQFTITEMVSVDRIIREKEDETTKIPKGSPSTGIQLFGSDPKIILEAAEKFERSKFAEINLNVGCSVPKVVKKGAGAALLKNTKKLEEIIKLLSTNLKKPISVKTRLGYSSPSEIIDIAKVIERAGASSIILHARTAVQGYSGNAEWNWIKKVKEEISIPIYGNGDVRHWEDAYKMLEETNCDGVYIGRAAIASPIIFRECKLKKSIRRDEKLAGKIFLEYYKLRKKYKLKDTNLKAMGIALCTGFEGAKELRRKISESRKEGETLEIFDV